MRTFYLRLQLKSRGRCLSPCVCRLTARSTGPAGTGVDLALASDGGPVNLVLLGLRTQLLTHMRCVYTLSYAVHLE